MALLPIPTPPVPIAKPDDGKVSKSWYDWFLSLQAMVLAGGGGGGGGAPATATYVTLSTDATLTNERVLTAGTNITVVDGGAGGAVTINSTAGGAPVGASYLTLGTDATLTSERVLTAGTNITLVDGGAGSTLTVNASGGGGVSDGDKTDITVSGGGTIWTVDPDVVTNAKLANMAQATIKGRATGAGTGDPTDLTGAQARAIIGGRETLAADRTYFVSTTGSDSNDGLSGGAPFLTIQKAINTFYTLDGNGFAGFISCAAGTYGTGVGVPVNLVGPFIGFSMVTLQGDLVNVAPTAPDRIITSTLICIAMANGAANFRVQGFELNTAAGFDCILLDTGSRLQVTGNMRFGNCNASVTDISVTANSLFQSIGTSDYSISGAHGTHWRVSNGGRILDTFKNIHLISTPTFGTGANSFAWAEGASGMQVFNNIFVGTATGLKFFVKSAGVIDTAGRNVDYLPGNVTGVNNGGFYV